MVAAARQWDGWVWRYARIESVRDGRERAIMIRRLRDRLLAGCGSRAWWTIRRCCDASRSSSRWFEGSKRMYRNLETSIPHWHIARLHVGE
jgi:hypothetical protein